MFILATEFETCWIRTAHPEFSAGKKKKVGSHSPVFPSPLSIAHLVVSDWLFTLASGRARQRQTVRQTHTYCRYKHNNPVSMIREVNSHFCHLSIYHNWLIDDIAILQKQFSHIHHSKWQTILQSKINHQHNRNAFTVTAKWHDTWCHINTKNSCK